MEKASSDTIKSSLTCTMYKFEFVIIQIYRNVVMMNIQRINLFVLFPRFPVAVKSTRHVWNSNNHIPLPYRKGISNWVYGIQI